MSDKGFLVFLALAVLAAVSPGVAWAGGGVPGSAAEESDYSSREAQSGPLDQFVGGDAASVLLVLILLVGIGVLIYFMFFSDDPWVGEPKADRDAEADRSFAK